MMRRFFWMLAGIGLGAVVGAAIVRWAARTKQRYAPPNLARGAGRALESIGARVRDAIDEGLREMVDREAELRVELDLPPR